VKTRETNCDAFSTKSLCCCCAKYLKSIPAPIQMNLKENLFGGHVSCLLEMDSYKYKCIPLHNIFYLCIVTPFLPHQKYMHRRLCFYTHEKALREISLPLHLPLSHPICFMKCSYYYCNLAGLRLLSFFELLFLIFFCASFLKCSIAASTKKFNAKKIHFAHKTLKF